MKSATRPVMLDLIVNLICSFVPDALESQEIMDALMNQLKFRYGDETADCQHEYGQLRQALDELELTQTEEHSV